jgi:pimeloyl-ACP methyl ester carboxylesterase
MRLTSLLVAAALIVSVPGLGFAQPVPPAVITDPVPDAKFPARLEVVHIPTGGVKINGIAYVAQGPGAHPTFVFFHGLPGNEKNLDLVQAVRRAGWTAVAVNYRGSWGSPGSYRFANNLEDAKAVMAYLRDPANAKALGVDPTKIVIGGHSMGGWVVAHTASQDHKLLGAVMISAGDMGTIGLGLPRPALVQEMSQDMESLADVTPDSMADELIKNGEGWTFAKAAPGLGQTPLFVLTSDDGLAGQSDALSKAVKDGGGKQIKTLHVATDHSWSDRRIALQAAVVTWLDSLIAKP